MNNMTIECPNCGTEIDVSDALSHELSGEIRKELEGKQSELVARAVARAQEEKSLELADLQAQLAEKAQKLDELKESQLMVKRLQREMEEARASAQEQVSQQVEAGLQKAREEAANTSRVKAEEAFNRQRGELEKQLAEQKKATEEQTRIELELREKARALEKKSEQAEIDLQRRLDAEISKVKTETTEQLRDEQQRKLSEREKTISDLRKALDDATRKAEQGSMQTQGEVLELELEEQLTRDYPLDEIEPVAKGARGADIIQRVKDPVGLKPCGSILIETKNAQNWASKWIEKVKEDQLAASADIAVIVSRVMPDEEGGPCQFVDGVWVTRPTMFSVVISMLRVKLHEIYRVKRAHEGGEAARDMLFRYITGSDFRQRMQSIVEVLDSQQELVTKERRAMEKIWKTRETQAQRAVMSLASISGDITGLLGSDMPSTGLLELDEIVPDED